MRMNKLPVKSQDKNRPSIHRISMNQMFMDTLSVLNLDRGILHTMWQMTIRPGSSIRRYLFDDRRKFVHPLRFLFLSAAIAAFINTQFITTQGNFDEAIQNKVSINGDLEQSEDDMVTLNLDTDNDGTPDAESEVSTKELQKMIAVFVVDFLNRYFSLILILFVPIISLFTWIFFRKSNFYYGEHLAVNAFYLGYLNVIYILISPLLIWGHVASAVMLIYFIFGVIFQLFIYARVFERKWLNVIINGSAVMILSYIVYFLVILGFFIILLNRYVDTIGLQ